MLRDERGRRTDVFTLQWHLTNACGSNCAHCYDRSARKTLAIEEARRVLGDFTAFCWRQGVAGRISLTGGDPLLYPDFWELYESVAEAGVPVALLGNPIGTDEITALLRVQRPLYYQISLEGRREHNDSVRGSGHFDRARAFLDAAERLGLPVHVMLTLTRSNIDEVVPLASELRGRAARLTFNRLAQVGAGASLAAPTSAEYSAFLERYLLACGSNPLLGLKDNLINVTRAQRGARPFPGCTGHGCGAAFDFLALLPDGEVHACRKLPSLVGHMRDESLDAAYHSTAASRYRRGSAACQACRLRPHCGGCMAVSFGRGRDPLLDRDPDCLYDGY
jgi:selenobiotic family peptide radical SAM maturase